MGVGGELLLSVLAVELRLGRDMSWEAIMWALIWSNGRKAAIVARVESLICRDVISTRDKTRLDLSLRSK